jgi:glycosyltransferase 2 family protein
MRTRLVAVLLLTLLCLGWVVWGIDAEEAVAGLGRFRWGYLAPIWLTYLAAHGLRAQRYRILLPQPLDYRASFSALSIGYLALNVVPLRLGELVRPYLLREQRGVPLGDSLAAVVFERMLDVTMLLFMILGTTWLVDLPTGLTVRGVDLLGIAQRGAGALVAVGAGGLVGVLILGPRVLRLTDRLPFGAPFRAVFQRFHGAVAALAARPAIAAQAFLLSVAIWTLTLFAVQLQLMAAPGLPAGWDTALATWTATLSGMTVLPTPGFFGGFEAACVAALQLLGATADQAAPFAILLHLTQFVFTVALGITFLVREGLDLRQVVARSREA